MWFPSPSYNTPKLLPKVILGVREFSKAAGKDGLWGTIREEESKKRVVDLFACLERTLAFSYTFKKGVAM